MTISIEVAYAMPNEQKVVSLEVADDCSAIAAVEKSGLALQFSFELGAAKLGVFGKAVKHDYVVRSGDRIEIYRPLIADPKAARKERADKAKQAKQK